MSLTRRSLLSRGVAASAAICFDPGYLFPATSGMATAPDLAADPLRPQFHLVPPSNWINDPNGPIYWNGKYHLFYQANPICTCFGKMIWGHAMSPDMLHWKHMPPALTPTPGGPDSDGCWTGTAVVRDGVVTLIYTGVSAAPNDVSTAGMNDHTLREQQCLAYSTDPDLKTWTKHPKAVIPAPPAGLPHLNGFRDPSPWREGEDWYMVVGSGLPKTGGAVLLYRSKDLRHWEYRHIAANGDNAIFNQANPVQPSDMWECPDLFPLGEKHVLICSTKGKAHWQTGVLDKETMLFHCEHTGILDTGAYYAPKTQLDTHGNRILWGWIVETRPQKEYSREGWAGMMSLPRVLTVSADGQLEVQVAPAVETLRRKRQNLHITPDEEKNRQQIGRMLLENCCGEILGSFPTDDGAFSLSIFGEAAPDWITIEYDPQAKDRIMIGSQIIPINLAGSDGLEIRIFVDGSVAEIFVNRQVAYTKRFYYTGTKAPRVGVRIGGNTARIRSFSIWQIAPVSADRLTT